MQITVCVYNNVCFANTSSFNMQLFFPDQAACSAANTAAVIFTQKKAAALHVSITSLTLQNRC